MNAFSEAYVSNSPSGTFSFWAILLISFSGFLYITLSKSLYRDVDNRATVSGRI